MRRRSCTRREEASNGVIEVVQINVKFLETNFGLFGDKADKDIQKLIEYYRDRF